MMASSFAPLVLMGTEILKAVLSINGGAAVATLWFIGNVLRDRPSLAVLLVLMVWVFVTSWYLLWGLWLVPYRVLRRQSYRDFLRSY